MGAYRFAHDTPIGSTSFSNKIWEPIDVLMIPFYTRYLSTHNTFSSRDTFQWFLAQRPRVGLVAGLATGGSTGPPGT